MSLNKSFAKLLRGTAIMSLPAFSQREVGKSEVSGTFVYGTFSDDLGEMASGSGGGADLSLN